MDYNVRAGLVGDSQRRAQRLFRAPSRSGIRIVASRGNVDFLERRGWFARFGARAAGELFAMDHLALRTDKLGAKFVFRVRLQVKDRNGVVRIVVHLHRIEQPARLVADKQIEFHLSDFRGRETIRGVKHNSHRMEITVRLGAAGLGKREAE